MAKQEAETPVVDEPMSLDEHVEEVAATPAKDNDGIPYCRKHHCRMKQASGPKKNQPTAYYKCPVSSCEEKEQIIKTSKPGVVPPKPLPCPKCSSKKKLVYCERDTKSSTAGSVILKCPSCEWKSTAMVVPQLAAAHFASRREVPVENIGDR